MNRPTRYIIKGLLAMLLTGISLFILVAAERPVNIFYESLGVIPFTQYLLLAGSLLALCFLILGTWHFMMVSNSYSRTFLFLAFLFPPLLFCTAALYASLTFLCLI